MTNLSPTAIDELLPSTIKKAESIDDIIPPCNVMLSQNPFYDTESIQIDIRGKHPTQGLLMEPSNDWDNRVIIVGCHPGTSGRRIKSWTTRIKKSLLISINNQPISTIAEAQSIISNIVQSKQQSFTIEVCADEKSALHHEEGIPMLYFDQLATISSHLHAIKYNMPNAKPHTFTKVPSQQPTTIPSTVNKIQSKKGILPKNKRKSNKLTRRKLKKMENWILWRNSEWKQLDQYEEQETFGAPCPLPPGANVLDLLWTYIVKTCGTLKARCVCNGQPSNRNTVIFGYTFAKMLDHVGSRIFGQHALQRII